MSRPELARKLADWSMIFGVVGLVYVGCLVVGGVISLLGLSSYVWHLIYMWLGFHLNTIIVLCALVVGLSAFTFTRAAVFSKQLSADLAASGRPSGDSTRHLKTTFVGICMLALTIIFGVLYLVVAMYMDTPLPE
ncbi:MAG: hypothetical protein AAGF87_13235 [Bacteroidota bacterium]